MWPKKQVMPDDELLTHPAHMRGDVLVTADEVESALTGGLRTVLAVVSELEPVKDDGGECQVSGGRLHGESDWKPSPSRLVPIQ
ncbi:hypothetical protein KZ829_40740 [Actinoplanes hulinensis]|uniref:Uncharacterized protein n=1 Tax=Actinoplanes hulinensis TaxID=1144547 RepID=A0ABS7BGW5_9ACTN|nr:hypothetical protein [Actinoplanes hulinensis]MBW6440070.1 hypothetical protein [Actinoplanes hulinensis]